MRKIVTLLVAVFILALSSVTFAYPTYLNGDSNYILCDANMGYGKYINQNSLNIKKYAPPEYIILVEVVTVPDADIGKTRISERKTYAFRYNYDQRRMYVHDDNDEDDWILAYLDPNIHTTGTRITRSIGEMAFYLAYKTPFYGKKAGYEDSFYNRI